MDIVLIAGLWLDGGSAWDEVGRELTSLGHCPVPVTLPGQGDGNATATLADQLATVLAAVDAADGPALVVGHSAASTLAWLAADARLGQVDAGTRAGRVDAGTCAGQVAKVAFIGGWPAPDGRAYFGGFEVTDGAVPFPGWATFEGPDSADLDDTAMRAIAAAAIPVPEGVARGVVRYSDPRRYAVPAVLICPEAVRARRPIARQAAAWSRRFPRPPTAAPPRAGSFSAPQSTLFVDNGFARVRQVGKHAGSSASRSTRPDRSRRPGRAGRTTAMTRPPAAPSVSATGPEKPDMPDA